MRFPDQGQYQTPLTIELLAIGINIQKLPPLPHFIVRLCLCFDRDACVDLIDNFFAFAILPHANIDVLRDVYIGTHADFLVGMGRPALEHEGDAISTDELRVAVGPMCGLVELEAERLIELEARGEVFDGDAREEDLAQAHHDVGEDHKGRPLTSNEDLALFYTAQGLDRDRDQAQGDAGNHDVVAGISAKGDCQAQVDRIHAS